MLQILVRGVFYILSGIASIVLTPILAAISIVIPDFTNSVNAVTSWVTTGLTAVPFLIKLLGVPLEAVAFFFSYWALIFGISLTIRAIIFIKNIYQTFKP